MFSTIFPIHLPYLLPNIGDIGRSVDYHALTAKGESLSSLQVVSESIYDALPVFPRSDGIAFWHEFVFSCYYCFKSFLSVFYTGKSHQNVAYRLRMEILVSNMI